MTDGPRVALVTAATAPPGIDREFMTGTDAPLVAALERRGAQVSTPTWREDAHWEQWDVVVVRTTWDYVDHRDEFVAWAESVASRTRLCNPAEVIRWNTHKGYLLELEDRGAPIVPTAWIAAGDRVDLSGLLDARGWDEVVVKPAVDAGSRRLLRVGRDRLEDGQRHLDALSQGGADVMVQPYQPSVQREGELSVVVIDGRVSHAVRKRPAAGDFRVQHAYGGAYVSEPVDEQTIRLAEWVVGATGHDLLIARVDLLADELGAWQLAEFEATEPDLYLSTVPEAAERLAEAIVRRTET